MHEGQHPARLRGQKRRGTNKHVYPQSERGQDCTFTVQHMAGVSSLAYHKIHRDLGPRELNKLKNIQMDYDNVLSDYVFKLISKAQCRSSLLLAVHILALVYNLTANQLDVR